MKEDKFNKKLMDYLENKHSEEIVDNEVIAQAEQIKALLSTLKQLPDKEVSIETDERFYKLLAQKQAKPKKQIPIIKWWPYAAIAASIALLFFVFITQNNIQDNYNQLASNPEKLNFIYNLYNRELKTNDIVWLNNELKKEENPNIKVLIIDLLTSYQPQLNSNFFNTLNSENNPTVQMAILSVLETSEHIDHINILSNFSQKSDLDHTVKLKATKLLSKQ